MKFYNAKKEDPIFFLIGWILNTNIISKLTSTLILMEYGRNKREENIGTKQSNVLMNLVGIQFLMYLLFT